MSKLYDGSDDPLTYGQALVLVAGQLAWPSEEARKEVTDAIRAEHGLTLNAIVPVYSDARDQLIQQHEAELDRLRKIAAEHAADAKVREQEAEIARLTALTEGADGEAPKAKAGASK